MYQTYVKRVFRYLVRAKYIGFWCPRDRGFNLIGYTDADYASYSIERKSTNGYCLLGIVSCYSKKQSLVASSTAEAECIAAGACCA